jgi:hypothetical protein
MSDQPTPFNLNIARRAPAHARAVSSRRLSRRIDKTPTTAIPTAGCPRQP